MSDPTPAETDSPPADYRTTPEQTAAALALIDAIYATIPDAGCKGLCLDECRFLVHFSPAEMTRLPIAYPAWGPETRDEPCGLFDAEHGKCSAYEHRPGVCRLYAVVDSPVLRCEHGCGPVDGQLISPEETVAYMQAVDVLGGGRFPTIVEPEGFFARVRQAFALPLLAGAVRQVADRTPDDLDVWLVQSAVLDAIKALPQDQVALRVARRADKVRRTRKNHPRLNQNDVMTALMDAFGGGVDAEGPEELAQMFGDVVEGQMPTGQERFRPPTPRKGKRTKQSRRRS